MYLNFIQLYNINIYIRDKVICILKYKLIRDFFINIYIIFIRLVLENVLCYDVVVNRKRDLFEIIQRGLVFGFRYIYNEL